MTLPEMEGAAAHGQYPRVGEAIRVPHPLGELCARGSVCARDRAQTVKQSSAPSENWGHIASLPHHHPPVAPMRPTTLAPTAAVPRPYLHAKG